MATDVAKANAASRGSVIIVSGATGVGKTTVSRLVAAAFDRSVHLQTDDLMASVVSGWVDPNLPEAEQQNAAIGGALAVSAMSFAENGYTTVVDGHLFPEGAVHGRFDDLDLDDRHVVEAVGSPEAARDAVLSAFRTGRLIVTEQPSEP